MRQRMQTHTPNICALRSRFGSSFTIGFISLTPEHCQHTEEVATALGDQLKADMAAGEHGLFIGTEAMETYQELCKKVPRGTAKSSPDGPWYKHSMKTIETDCFQILTPWFQHLVNTTNDAWWSRKPLPGIQQDIKQLPLNVESMAELLAITNCLRMM